MNEKDLENDERSESETKTDRESQEGKSVIKTVVYHPKALQGTSQARHMKKRTGWITSRVAQKKQKTNADIQCCVVGCDTKENEMAISREHGIAQRRKVDQKEKVGRRPRRVREGR